MNVNKYDFEDIFTLASIIRTLSYLHGESVCDVVTTGGKNEIILDLITTGIFSPKTNLGENIKGFHLDDFANIMDTLLVDEDNVEYCYFAALHISQHQEYKDSLRDSLENLDDEDNLLWDEIYSPLTDSEKRECINYAKSLV